MSARAALVNGVHTVIKITAILGTNPLKKITRSVIGVGMDAAAKVVQKDFEDEVKGWKHKPAFSITGSGDDKRSVTTDDEIFLYQDLGTKPHIIRPTRKRALSWPGASHPVKVVHHPGTKAQGFTVRVQRKAASRLLEAMNKAMEAALR